MEDTALINQIANLYADGKGVTQDSVKALALWEQSAELGNPFAMVEVAKTGLKHTDPFDHELNEIKEIKK